jgi:hypothetical protein
MEENHKDLKYYADWSQPQGKTTKKGIKVHIHPYDLISFVHKKQGIDKAGALAITLITQKYNRLLEESKG